MKLSRKQDFIHTSVLKSHISTTTITTTKYYYYAYIENHSYDDIVPRNNKNETESESSLRSLSCKFFMGSTEFDENFHNEANTS